jgi:hypothetical protein
LNLDDGNRRLREANRRSEVGGRKSDTDLVTLQPATCNLQLATSNSQAAIANHQAHCITFSYPFSINCIAYDYRHWQEIGGVPEEDENGWGKWIPEHQKLVVLAADALVHHYSFFVQQAWLDRTSLLEDIRRVNLGGSCFSLNGSLARFVRILRQIPDAVRRRFGGKK